MKKQAGFTLIETMIAIFLLTLTIGGLLTLAADGYFSVRYAKNQIIANDLLQEGLEYIRNDRDTSAQQGVAWQDWMAKYGGNNGCFSENGCMVDPYTTSTSHVIACTSPACTPFTFYADFGFYGYANSSAYPPQYTASIITKPYLTTYTRIITMQQAADPNQLTVTATLKWMNGNTTTSASQSILLTNWHD